MDEREPVFDRGFYFGEWLVGVVIGPGLRVGQALVLEVVGSGVGTCPSEEGAVCVGFGCVSVGLCSRCVAGFAVDV
jgi:hypothetical protein